MAARSEIRLLLLEHGIGGGVETVNIELVREFTELVERVVWVMPNARLEYFQQFLPASKRLIYQSPSWQRETWLYRNLKKAGRFILRQKPVPPRFAYENLRQTLSDLWLRQIIREYDITHCFCNWIVHVNAPRLSVPIGLMLMDVRWRCLPESFCASDGENIDRQFCDWLTKSSVVFPVSEATASDIKRFYPWYTGRSCVVPHGARSIRHNTAPSSRGSDSPRSSPLFYYPAEVQTHKNHLTLFEACAKLFAEGYDFELVLTGEGTGHFNDTEPNDAAPIELGRVFLQSNQALFRGRVISRGYCERGEVESLYKQCTAVVLPSRFEGFGLPLIEALQHGAEIICSDIPAHREQLTRYGCVDEVRLIPPGDATALAAEMEKILISSGRPGWRKRSQSNTFTQWTWKDAAAAYLESLSALTKPNCAP